jgi:hypothetical protein
MLSFKCLVFYWGKTLAYLWSLRLLVTGWTKWPKFWASRPEFFEFFFSKPNPVRKAHVTVCKNDDDGPSFILLNDIWIMCIACSCHETVHFKVKIFGGKAVQRGSTIKKAFFSTKHTHTFSEKKIFRQLFRFLANFEAKYIQFEDWFKKKGCIALLQIVSRFWIFYQTINFIINHHL